MNGQRFLHSRRVSLEGLSSFLLFPASPRLRAGLRICRSFGADVSVLGWMCHTRLCVSALEGFLSVHQVSPVIGWQTAIVSTLRNAEPLLFWRKALSSSVRKPRATPRRFLLRSVRLHGIDDERHGLAGRSAFSLPPWAPDAAFLSASRARLTASLDRRAREGIQLPRLRLSHFFSDVENSGEGSSTTNSFTPTMIFSRFVPAELVAGLGDFLADSPFNRATIPPMASSCRSNRARRSPCPESASRRSTSLRGIDRVRHAGFISDDLLRTQRDAHRVFGRQRQGLVVAVGVQPLRPPSTAASAWIATRAMLFFGCCAVSETPRSAYGSARPVRCVFRAETVLHQPDTRSCGQRVLPDLLEEIVVRVEEEAEARPELVDFQAAAASPLHVLDAIVDP